LKTLAKSAKSWNRNPLTSETQMANDKILLLTRPSDQGDIIKDYIEWHLDLGVDLILAQDCDSSDNTHEVLNSFSNTGQVHWFPTPVKNYLNYRPGEIMAEIAREQHGADWIIMSDVDEFLCPQGDDLRTILKRAEADDVTAISIPCLNMTGPPLSGGRATQTQTLRIDQPVQPTRKQWLSGNIPVPYIFMRHPPKTIVRTAAFMKYGPGSHEVKTAWGRTTKFPELRILHFPIRGFDKFQKKIANVTAYLEENTHLEAWWGWHWRRFIRLNQEGRLREDYESQSVSPQRTEELIRDGICSIDETIANWIKTRTNDFDIAFRNGLSNY
jgi:hypothetical protein